MPTAFRQACIVSYSAVTPVGLTASTTAAAVRAGVCRVGEHPRYRDREGEAFMVAMVPRVRSAAVLDRMAELGSTALDDACGPIPELAGATVPVYVGVREPRYYFPKDRAQALARGLLPTLQRHCRTRVSTVAGGNAAGLHALGIAKADVEQDRARFAIALGVDSHLDPEFLEWLDREGRYKSLANVHGFSPGEAAAAVVITREQTARALRIPVLARLEGYGCAFEPAAQNDEPCVGQRLASAALLALQSTLARERQVDDQYCDLSGEPQRTDEFVYFTQRMPPRVFRDITNYTTTAAACGDVGAASGPLMVALACEAALRDRANGPLALLWAASDNGQRAACVLDRKDAMQRTER